MDGLDGNGNAPWKKAKAEINQALSNLQPPFEFIRKCSVIDFLAYMHWLLDSRLIYEYAKRMEDVCDACLTEQLIIYSFL